MQRPARASAHASVSSPRIDGRSARAFRASATVCAGSMPWSARNCAVSRSVLIPFATSSRSITRTVAYCGARLARVADARIEIAELRHELGQRDRVDGALLEGDRGAETARARPRRVRARRARRRSPGRRQARCGTAVAAAATVALQPVQLAELHRRPGVALAVAGRRIERELHRRRGATKITVQLARVRDARVRREARLQIDHALEGDERLRVVSELDLRRRRRCRTCSRCTARAARRMRPTSRARRNWCCVSASEPSPCTVRGSRGLSACASRQRTGLERHERRVAGLPPALTVRQPEQRERLDVATDCACTRCLEPRDRRPRCRPPGREAGQRPLRPPRARRRSRRARRGRRREDASQQEHQPRGRRGGRSQQAPVIASIVESSPRTLIRP